ncbi:MAG: glycoside hydrolase family 127 protein [Chloroflexi bacterium]|nr:glycoside hydrolase family 127 protein [Chloroflexota bacterium]
MIAAPAPLTPVPFTHVTVSDAFWAPRIETNRTVTIPAEYEMCERTGRVAAFDLLWKPGDPNPPHVFWDSDMAKWIEAASYSLATRFDASLDQRLDSVIARIARAQHPDGYLNTHYTTVEPGKRWTNLRDRHELYCAGHLIEAAVAHYRATGKRALLDVLCRYADHIDATFGRESGKRRGYCGHEEIELALVKLYHVTGERRYLALAQYFVDERGQSPHYYDWEAHQRGDDPKDYWAKTYQYVQAHKPVRDQREAVGHSVRAMYLYSAMADLLRATGDAGLQEASESLWHSVCAQQMYVTGGIGPAAANEGFTAPYDLPDETAYAETCAAIGLVFWNHRLLQLSGDGRYADVMERALYNGVISGVSLDGRRFFYENPLASRGAHHRQDWFDCACCPPNLARLLASIGGYVYSQSPRDAWVHLFVQGEGRLTVDGRDVSLWQTTRYPWDGAVRMEVQPAAPLTFTLHVRLPGWCERARMMVNQTPVRIERSAGYAHITRRWKAGDTVELKMAMPVRAVYADPRVRQMLGRAALQRGPVVYCLEGADHHHQPLDRITLPQDTAPRRRFAPEYRADWLGGVTVLQGQGLIASGDWGDALYRAKLPAMEPVSLTAVPYCVWDNREPGEMRVWLRTGKE